MNSFDPFPPRLASGALLPRLMSDDLRRLLRTSLVVGGSFVCIGLAVVLGNGSGSATFTLHLILRLFFAGAAMPFVARLSGPTSSDSRVLLNVATVAFSFIAIVTAPYLLKLLVLPTLTLAALTTERFHRHGVVLMFVGLAVGAALWLVSWTGGLYLPPLWWGGMAGMLLTAGFWMLILTWALHRAKSWRRWRIALPALGMGVVASLLPNLPLARYANARYLDRRDLSAFAAQVLEYRRIEHLWEDAEHTYQLNETKIRPTLALIDSVPEWDSGRDATLLADVLARDSIDPAVYEDFRKQMQRLHFRRFEVRGDYVLFARTREWSLVYAKPGLPFLAEGAKVPGTNVTVGQRHGQWYFVC